MLLNTGTVRWQKLNLAKIKKEDNPCASHSRNGQELLVSMTMITSKLLPDSVLLTE